MADWIYARIKPIIDNVSNWIEGWATWLWNSISPMFTQVWGWIQGISAPIVAAVNSTLSGVWDWIQNSATDIVNRITGYFSQVWSWLMTGFENITQALSGFTSAIYDKVSQINQWFSDEFIDPFIDWLLKFPQNMTASLTTMINVLAARLESWFTHDSPGFPHMLRTWFDAIWHPIFGLSVFDFDWGPGGTAYDPGGPAAVIGLITAGLGGFFMENFALIAGKTGPFWGWILTVAPRIGGWFSKVFSGIWGWLSGAGLLLAAKLAEVLPRIGGWFASKWIPLLGSSAILGLEATGRLEGIINKFVSPAIDGILKWAEGMGPVSPQSGAATMTGITKLATFTVSGLAAMTLAGEALSPLKHIGLGHIAAVVYDMINYKTLTAAFMGVLAFVYIRTPLTYYYNKIARPNIPDERGLRDMLGSYDITQDEFISWMQFHGYTDEWSAKMISSAFRPLTPFLLRSLAEAGLLPEEVLDRELHHAGYREEVIPIIKQMMINLASGALAAVSSSTAMTRFQEGFDDEPALRQNLLTLGIAPQMLDRYVFAAQLKYLYDYQVDLKTFYIDEYHRRVIEEPELRSSLTQAGLAMDRLDLVVDAQKIKRLAAPKAAVPPELAIELSTIRDRRAKNLITRNEEVQQLVTIGEEMPYALAIAANDDVKLAKPNVPVVVVQVPEYETEAGKVQVDTIRRLRRQGQSSADEELTALSSLQMPAGLAQAIVDNDALRIKASAAGGA